ncbi:hypothetical protein COT87_01310 [Candidatus Collierbacteria bacterium CG10_big_fil_rev_8_21_14_0_10_44_9]|uniref:PrgI family protein n=1 Tax=Candidatus Collierbacteria bacterium CG10_big_fil_rev_8_21_14_0_10_44_9 TaxID=1974535 RepID=A0A2H0VL59_9BACT|nr:MAG: hypothetical protein COT87_01310 [Candidatus Collierbacteria bacterium CG10_big_fil_rev_8_21_14_0_10_44_9]
MPAKIPQDVTREDRLVGPLTLKQFLYVLAGASIIFIAYQYYALQYLYLIEFAVISLIVGSFTIAFAFSKVNGQPFGIFIANLFKFWLADKQRIWHKEPREKVATIKVSAEDLKDTKSELQERKQGKEVQSQLEKLSRVLDAGGTIKPEYQDVITTQVNNLNPSPSAVNETGLDVEDVLAENE